MPKRIYLFDYNDAMVTPLEGDTVYVREDAFIEKAETYLKEKFAKDVSVLAGGAVHINFETAINNFINYMKGE